MPLLRTLIVASFKKFCHWERGLRERGPKRGFFGGAFLTPPKTGKKVVGGTQNDVLLFPSRGDEMLLIWSLESAVNRR
jgi:hypothetical protein